MKPIFQKNLDIFDLEIVKKTAQIEVFGHFLDFASLVFLDFAHNDRWAWSLVVFLQFAGPVNVFLFSLKFEKSLFKNKIFSFISRSKMTVHTAEKDQIKYFDQNWLGKTTFLYM